MFRGAFRVPLVNRMVWPPLPRLPMAFIAAAAISVAFERTMFYRLYRSSDLDQCLLTIGLVFVSVATAAYIYGTIQQPVNLPNYLRGSIHVGDLTFGVYRIFLIVF